MRMVVGPSFKKSDCLKTFHRVSTHLFNQDSLSFYVVPGTIADSGVAAIEKTDKNPDLHRTYPSRIQKVKSGQVEHIT